VTSARHVFQIRQGVGRLKRSKPALENGEVCAEAPLTPLLGAAGLTELAVFKFDSDRLSPVSFTLGVNSNAWSQIVKTFKASSFLLLRSGGHLPAASGSTFQS
jgi:hypothetical protein